MFSWELPILPCHPWKKLPDLVDTVAGVVTQPDKPRGRGLKVLPGPVKKYALNQGISPILQPENFKQENFQHHLIELKADIFVVVAFRIFPQAIFTIPRLGAVNLHPSLLPKYRGAAPINWTIINGEKQTGVTIIQIGAKIDAGGILLQESVELLTDETAGELHDRLAVQGADLLVSALDLIESGSFSIIRQDDSMATPAPKLQREDCHISFNQSVREVKNRINGLSPYPTGFAILDGERINFFKASIWDSSESPNIPGTVVEGIPDNLLIACQPGIVEIHELQKEGKKRLNTPDFLRGFPVTAGTKFY